MGWARIRDWLLPGGMEDDEGFRQEILSASYRGARIVAGAEAVVAFLARAGMTPRPVAFALLLLPVLTLGITSLLKAYPYNRALLVVSSTAAALIAVRSLLAGVTADFALGSATFLILAAVTSAPL